MRIWRIFPGALLAVVWGVVAAAVARAQTQEFRGAWVASAWNINFPSKAGLSQEEQRREIARIVAAARAARLNHLFVQVRPESCALYPSSLEPWSRFLTGTQGRSPGFDPLAEFLAQGQRHGVRIHAWLNPYRAAVNAGQPRHPAHISNRLPQHTKRIGNLLWMDPGAPEVRRHVLRVVRDLVERYPGLAGIHYDDYFYPYPPPGRRIGFPDEDTYSAYRRAGGTLSRDDWRRHNVNELVRQTRAVVKELRPDMLFGVSPFGIYTRGEPPEVKAGLDQLNQIYADPVRWLREGWVDYLVPQLYWRERSEQSFSALLRWWRSQRVNPRGIPIYAGIAADRLTGSHNWPVEEIALQLRIERQTGPKPHGGGFVLYNIGQVIRNTKGLQAVLAP